MGTRGGIFAAFLVVATLGYSITAHATLIDDFIDIDLVFEDTLIPGVVLFPGIVLFDESGVNVGAGVEADSGLFSIGRRMTVDILAEQIIVTEDDSDSGGFGLSTSTNWDLTLSDLDWIGAPTGIVTGLVPDAANPTGILSTSFTLDSITISGGGYGVNSGDFYQWTFDIVTDHAAVPEPTALALLGIGLAGIGYGRKTRPGRPLAS